jgi:high affinity Mn2+ porin
LTVTICAGAHAAERENTPAFNWTGYYIGGQLGYAWGNSDWHVEGAAVANEGTFQFFRSFDAFEGTGSYFAGLQAGYNYRLPSGVVIGFETDLLAPNTIMDERVLSSPAVGQATISEKVEMSGTLRGRLGFVHDNWLFYGTAGYAWSYDLFTRMQVAGAPLGGTAVPGAVEKADLWRNGFAIGAGVELPLATNWTASFEYLFTAFGAQVITFPAGGERLNSDLAIQGLRVGLNYQFGEDSSDSTSRGPSPPDSDRWSVHGQATFVQQYAFPFPAPYRGPNSLDPNAGRGTSDVTFYVGVRLWPGAELWFNPEIDQGFGLSNTLGVAGFTSGEAYKVGENFPYARLPRTFIRQTFDLGGDSEKVEAGINQLAGTQTKDRLVVTVGKFAVTDIFDTNKYAHDARSDFMNWAVIDTGTFDYAADAWGYTYGAAVEWYKGLWTLRAGLFDLSLVPNSTDLDPTFGQVQWIGEVERRYTLWGQPGKVAFTGFLTRGRMGSFAAAIQLAEITGQPADIAAVRRYQSRAGASFNLEQQLTPEIGVFARAGVAGGDVEPYEFTDIDRTIAAGGVISGKLWGRAEDQIGVAGVVNGISKVHEAFLNAGGLGILVGDGMLPHPGEEKIIETYYSFPVLSWRATIDYQAIWNPAYNTDRGPVSIIGTRLHKQF